MTMITKVKFGKTQTIPYKYDNFYLELESDIIDNDVDTTINNLKTLVETKLSSMIVQNDVADKINNTSERLKILEEELANKSKEIEDLNNFLDNHKTLVAAYEETTGKSLKQGIPF